MASSKKRSPKRALVEADAILALCKKTKESLAQLGYEVDISYLTVPVQQQRAEAADCIGRSSRSSQRSYRHSRWKSWLNQC